MFPKVSWAVFQLFVLACTTTVLDGQDLEFFNSCQLDTFVDTEVILTLKSKSSAKQTCVATLTAPPGWRLHLHWDKFWVGTTRTCLHEFNFCTHDRRDQDGINVLDSDGTSIFLPLDRYYASVEKPEKFNDEALCRKYGIAKPSCDVVDDWAPQDYGNIRDFISSGESITIDYVGLPFQDYFNLQVTPVRELETCNGKTCGVGFCAYDDETCMCPSSHTGPTCGNAVDECNVYKACRAPHHYCINTEESFYCECRPGYQETEDNITCTDINECEADDPPCDEFAHCNNTEGSFTCTCQSGYVGDGFTCRKDCSVEPCENGGTCVTTASGNYTCDCPLFFTGTHCETEVSVCESAPCLNGGTCNFGPNGFVCDCRLGFVGRTCKYEDVTATPDEPSGCQKQAVNLYAHVWTALILTRVWTQVLLRQVS